MKTDELIQKYLKGKTNRTEEKELLNICLKSINDFLFRFVSAKKEMEVLRK